MGKKLLPVIIILMLSILLPGETIAQDQVSVTLGTVTLGVGESGTVNALIDCPLEGGCSGFDIEIGFDPNVIRIDHADVGPYLGSDSFQADKVVDNETGIVRLAAVAVGAEPELGEPVLFSLAITAVAPGVATLSIYNLLIADLVGNPVEARGISGAVVVQEAILPTPGPAATTTPPMLSPTTGPNVTNQTIENAWANSGHADAESEAFRRWDMDNPMEVPTSCAKCHSAYGYLDFVGADGSEAGVVDAAAPVDSVISCEVCHNDVAVGLESVVFPSGMEVSGLGESTRCVVCHQGRAAGSTVDSQIASASVDNHVVSENLGFINIHFLAAGATLFGADAGGIYQYEGKEYTGRFAHVPGYDNCTGCHSPHTLTVKLEDCTICHAGMEAAETIRMMSGDWDGDGDAEEGVAGEIETLNELLIEAIVVYAAEVVGTPIVYESHTYPYFFIDTNGDGRASAEEANHGNRYATWTPTLLRAAYNYHFAAQDPGGYAHNAKYVAQALYDSIEAIGGDVSGLNRP